MQDNEPLRWNLAALYQEPTDPQWELDLTRLRELARAFRRDFRGRVAGERLSAELLAAALRNFEQLQRQGLKPYFFAQLLFAEDGTDEATKALLAKVRECWSAVNEETLFFELEVLLIDSERLAVLLKEPELGGYAHYLQRLRAHAPYTLTEEVEQVLKRKDLSGREAFVQLFEEVTAALTFSFAFPGEESPRETTGEELLALLYHPDAAIREQAFATFLHGHADQALVLGSCFNNILLDHGKEVELRRYPDLMTPTHLECETEAAMVERMMEVTEANYGLARDYFEVKRRLLGLERMKNTDIYAPVAATHRDIPFAEAKDLVLEAFAGFSPDMAELANGFFREGRIDSHPRPGKSAGAFCMGLLPGYQPLVLLNYTGNPRDVATLAHELGHGVHFALSQQQSVFDYQATLPLAETASVFGEMLLTRHLLDRDESRQGRIALLCAKLEDIIATTFRQNLLTRFELAAHRRRGEGLLSTAELGELWWQENAKLFGSAVEMIEPYRWGWSYIGHFIHARFYCYSYVFGELLTLALYQRYLAEGAGFAPKFLDLLRKGGSQSPRELLKPLGIDLTDPGFWQQGYDVVGGLLAELRTLLDGE